MQNPSSCSSMPLAPLDLVPTSMGPGSEVTGNDISNYPSAPYSGRSSLP